MREFSYRLSKWFLMIVFAFGSLSVASFARAAEESMIASIEPSGSPEGMVNCFDYYHFNSVKADIEGLTAGTVSGVPMNFKGNVINENSYPIVAGALYAKIFKKQSDDSLIHANGHNLVDQFFVQDNMSLPAKGQVPVSFQWQVPSYAVSGDYQITFFFTSAKKYNLLGLSFTDDVIGNTFNFKVKGEQKDRVFLDKNTVRIGEDADMDYRFASPPPRQDKDKDIPVTVKLVNPLDAPQTATLIWKVYGWDAQNESNLLDTKTETINLAAKETKSLQYVDTKRTYSVHFLVAEARYQDTKSILDIRYVREGVDTLRINFPSITSYPLEQGKENAVFSCAHNAGENVIPGSKLVLTLRDQAGNTIHTYSYDGSISADMMGVKDNFTPKETYKDFSLEAQLYQDGKVVDQAIVQYDCEKIVGVDCPKKEETVAAAVINPNENSMEGSEASWILKGIIAVIVVLLGTLLFYVIRNAKNNQLGMFVFVLVFVSGLGFGGVKEAEAEDVMWSMDGLFNTTLCASMGDGWIEGLSDITGAITYHANVTDGNDVSIGNNSTVSIGSQLKINVPYSDTDIVWHGTGGWIDSPYGTWRQGATAPDSVLDYYLITTRGVNYYAPLSVNRSSNSLVSDDYLDCNKLDDRNYSCTVKKTGNFSVAVLFEPTFGKFYEGIETKNDPLYYDKNPLSKDTTAEHLTAGTLEASLTPPCKWRVPYTLSVPRQRIAFNFTANDNSNNGNRPPSTPIIEGPTEGYAGDPQQFYVSSVDPDTDPKDDIQFEVKWDTSEVSDTYNFKTRFLVSEQDVNGNNLAVKEMIGRTWNWPGTSYRFKVRAIDSRGAKSDWAEHGITIKEGSAPSTTSPSTTLPPTTPPTSLPICSCDINTANQKCDYETFVPKITPCASSLVCYGKKSCPRNWNEIPPVQ